MRLTEYFGNGVAFTRLMPLVRKPKGEVLIISTAEDCHARTHPWSILFFRETRAICRKRSLSYLIAPRVGLRCVRRIIPE